MIFVAFFRAFFLNKFFIRESLKGSCSVVIRGVFVDGATIYANLPLAGFQMCAWRMSMPSSLIIFLSWVKWRGSCLCFTLIRITFIPSFSKFSHHLSREL